MSNAYLDVAERVLRIVKRPLNPVEILEIAYETHLVPPHLFGATQHKTLQARLSEDVLHHPESSKFYRTDPALFFLKDLRFDPSIKADTSEYRAPRRSKFLKRGKYLYLASEGIERLVPKDDKPFKIGFDEGCFRNFAFFSDWDAPINEGLLLRLFIVTARNDSVLSFKLGYRNINNEILDGERSIGFGSVVEEGARDLFGVDGLGIISSAISELAHNLGMPPRIAEQARYENLVEAVGLLQPIFNVHDRSIHLILVYHCPDEFEPIQGSLSSKDFRWVTAANPTNRFEDYDVISRELFFRSIVTKIISN